jgi:hypothetical protein
MKKKSPGVEIILLTAHGNIPDGVQAIPTETGLKHLTRHSILASVLW